MGPYFNFKQDVWTTEEPYYTNDGFWYDITDGGYINPKDFLRDQTQIDEVEKALYTLTTFYEELVQAGLLEEG